MSNTAQLQFIPLVIGAVGVTVGLAWNNAITAIINHYIPNEANSKSMWIKIGYALGLTMLAGVLAKFIDKYSK
jgi:predicted lysophospholipase L1 biosynthesis ABC-type transport system permease subunit